MSRTTLDKGRCRMHHVMCSRLCLLSSCDKRPPQHQTDYPQQVCGALFWEVRRLSHGSCRLREVDAEQAERKGYLV